MSDAFFKNLELQKKEMGQSFGACPSCINFASTFGAKVNEKLKEEKTDLRSLLTVLNCWQESVLISTQKWLYEYRLRFKSDVLQVVLYEMSQDQQRRLVAAVTDIVRNLGTVLQTKTKLCQFGRNGT
jgi:hypothetical protein